MSSGSTMVWSPLISLQAFTPTRTARFTMTSTVGWFGVWSKKNDLDLTHAVRESFTMTSTMDWFGVWSKKNVLDLTRAVCESFTIANMVGFSKNSVLDARCGG